MKALLQRLAPLIHRVTSPSDRIPPPYYGRQSHRIAQGPYLGSNQEIARIQVGDSTTHRFVYNIHIETKGESLESGLELVFTGFNDKFLVLLHRFEADRILHGLFRPYESADNFLNAIIEYSIETHKTH
ncbi:hypothetical protein CMO83_03280 [Candidatus Woesearchaeota archaeon]|jgi:hypothetical protein|nr:hypothetical protein [Candidatus Woesearchaeota archaeon]MDP6647933.1 hypothetical protein [Candidatus Woesearchaeota archaeon]